MAISYNWLKKYFPDVKLPGPKEVADGIIFHSFEVEDLIEKSDDYLLDIKVLPDRTHDCLCHRGIAREISAIFNLPLTIKAVGPIEEKTVNRSLNVIIDDQKLCRRYIGRLIEEVNIGTSPEWLTKALTAIDQRSINSVVDLANYVMFDLGQPLHAFDADKVKGDIVVRLAKGGEKITTLDNRDVDLDEETLVIADEDGPLAIAGIKGGKRAEVNETTKNIILESANFHPVSVRRTSGRLGIRTDASKRFENELSTEVAGYAMDEFTDLVLQLAGSENTKVGAKIDKYVSKNLPPIVTCAVSELVNIIGVAIPQSQIVEILERLGMTVGISGEVLTITPPPERIDIDIKESIVEEVGRIYGYDKIAPLPLGLFTRIGETSIAEKNYAIQNKIREILLARGFSEVALYPIVHEGEVELANPLAEDKSYLRDNLWAANLERLAFNLQYSLFDHEPTKIFELGHIFKRGIEEAHLSIGVSSKAKKFDATLEITSVINDLNSTLGVDLKNCLVAEKTDAKIKGQVIEIHLDKLAQQVSSVPIADLDSYIASDKVVYKPVSSYPRIIRDVAVWVLADTELALVQDVIKTAAGPLLDYGPVLFDTFEKEGRKSLALRYVLQSYERTLSDDEANAVMDNVIKALEAKGWEVRK